MLKRLDNFLRETKMLRLVIALPVAFVILKLFGFLLGIATVLDGTI